MINMNSIWWEVELMEKVLEPRGLVGQDVPIGLCNAVECFLSIDSCKLERSMEVSV